MNIIALEREKLNSLYKEKLMSAEEAILILDKNTAFVTFGCYGATPVVLTREFARAAGNGYFNEVVTAYLFRSSSEIISFFNDENVLKNLRLELPFIGGEIGTLLKTARDTVQKIQYPEYVPGHFSLLGKGIKSQYDAIDVHMMQVSPMDEHGYFSFGLDGSFSIPAARNARKVIVEVNPCMPRTFGDGIIHINQISGIVEHESEVLTLPAKDITEIDKKIASNIIDLIADSSCIQLGIGGVPDSIGEFLKNKNDLAIHTELLTASQIELILNGNVNNKYKALNRYHTVFNVAMLPTKEHYKFMDNNPSMLCYPASYVNNASIISQIDNMISVNSFIEIDLFGQVASESLNWHQITGTGGQVDFVRGAVMSEGGKSFLAAHSTTKKNSISKIVPRLNNIVTTVRTDVQYVVTEYGCVNLLGKSNRERAKALISLAHPEFRDELTHSAKDMGLIR